MTREDAKDLTLSILVIVVALLLADCIWLHVKCAGQQDAIDFQQEEIAKCTSFNEMLAKKFDLHVNPPAEPSVADKAKVAYTSAKEATVREYEKVKAAAKAGYEAAKSEYSK